MTKRHFGLGDIVTIFGIVVYFLCLIVHIAKYYSYAGVDIVLSGQIVLFLLTSMPVMVLVFSFKNERLLNLQYAFTGFIVLLKLSQVSVLVERAAGLDFYIILGALAIGVGAYLAQVGIGEMKMGGAPAAPVAPAGIEDRLRELGRLKEAGLITEQEHAKKREEILGDLP